MRKVCSLRSLSCPGEVMQVLHFPSPLCPFDAPHPVPPQGTNSITCEANPRSPISLSMHQPNDAPPVSHSPQNHLQPHSCPRQQLAACCEVTSIKTVHPSVHSKLRMDRAIEILISKGKTTQHSNRQKEREREPLCRSVGHKPVRW